MKALHPVKFPRMVKLKRSMEERQYDESNQFRMNQNFKMLSDAMTIIEKTAASMPTEILSRVTVPLDWVTEAGEIDGWRYRKWSSKTAECWDDSVSIQKTIDTASGSLFYEDHVVSLPSTLFSSVRNVHVSAISSTVPIFLCLTSVGTGSITVRLISPVSGLATFTLNIYAIGAWEE